MRIRSLILKKGLVGMSWLIIIAGIQPLNSVSFAQRNTNLFQFFQENVIYYKSTFEEKTQKYLKEYPAG